MLPLILRCSTNWAMKPHVRSEVNLLSSYCSLLGPARFTALRISALVVRDRKIRTALRTYQIARFVTVPSWEKITRFNFKALRSYRVYFLRVPLLLWNNGNLVLYSLYRIGNVGIFPRRARQSRDLFWNLKSCTWTWRYGFQTHH